MRERSGAADAGITAEATAPPRSGEFAVSDAYRRYALGLLLVVYVVNFIDRRS